MQPPDNKPVAPQTFRNGEIHDWYKIVLGYSDHLVADLIDEFDLQAGKRVLDPFSGSGTTAVECKKRGIDCWAVDANPSSCFAAQVKTTWSIKPGELFAHAVVAANMFDARRRALSQLKADPTYRYVESSGMLKRKWITLPRLLDVIALKHAIGAVRPPRVLHRALDLALIPSLSPAW